MTIPSKSSKSHDSDIAFINALAELLNSSNLAELSVSREYGEHNQLTVSLCKYGKSLAMASAGPATPGPAAGVVPQNPVAPVASPGTDSDDPVDLPGAVISPMVGTIYLAAEPGAAPFVSLGQNVNEGDTLLIVEAMKTMNHIPSPKTGTVKRILVDDGTPVEYGAPLMIVE